MSISLSRRLISAVFRVRNAVPLEHPLLYNMLGAMPSSGQRMGVANLPLHYGKAPSWLFGRMCQLAREITIVTVYETPGSLRDPASYSFVHGGKDA